MTYNSKQQANPNKVATKITDTLSYVIYCSVASKYTVQLSNENNNHTFPLLVYKLESIES